MLGPVVPDADRVVLDVHPVVPDADTVVPDDLGRLVDIFIFQAHVGDGFRPTWA